MGGREITVGASLSLTGRYALQGGEAERGLRLWAAALEAQGGLALGARERRSIRLVVHDDGSRAAGLEANLARLLDRDRVDILFGPYGSDLTLRAGQAAAARGRVLWNHGGASDAVNVAAPGCVVSGIAPASSYLQGLPAFLRQWDPAPDRLAILHAAPGTFGAHVAAGLEAAARAAGLRDVARFPFEPPLAERRSLLEEVKGWGPRAVACAGRYEDDVWLARNRGGLLPDVSVFAAVGAGLAAFGAAAGPGAEGVVGPSHWEPPGGAAGSGRGAAGAFLEAYRRAYGTAPEYPAALVYAMGTVVAACAVHARTLDGAALRRAADALDVETVVGCFRLDPATGLQVGYRPLLVAWRGGTKRVLGGPVMV